MKPIGFIYLTTNTVNGKIYVGQHEVRNLKFNDSYIGSGGRRFQNALKKYGRKNFKRKILKLCYSINQLNAWEILFIKKLNATDPKIGYNQLPGPITLLNPSKLPEVNKIKSKKLSGENNPMYGRRGKLHPNYGKKRTKEQIAKLQGKNNPMFGKPSPFRGRHHTEEARRILSEKAKKRLKNKENNYWYGKHLSEEAKKKISKMNSGENNYWYGKRHSSETINKMRQSSLGGKRAGINNGAYGKIWITNGYESKFGNFEEIPEGWRRGKKIIRKNDEKDKNNR